MHDWIAFEAYLMAKDNADVRWLTDNMGMFLYGTEVPDNGVIRSVTSSLHPEGSFHDQGACHCILFDARENVTNDRMEVRAQQEFDKAKAALATHNPQLAAFYAGAMAHYLGDLSQFMHIMGVGSHWGAENSAAHSSYENVADRKIDGPNRKSLIFETYVKKKVVAGSTAAAVALTIAKFTETGGRGVNSLNTGQMYETWLRLRRERKSSPAKWPQDFMDQTGHNINESINGVDKLLKMLSE